jgi:hypothetical protein
MSDKIKHRLEELTIAHDHRGLLPFRRLQGEGKISEIHAPDEQTYWRHDHFVDQDRDYLPKGRPDDDSDRHVDYVPLHRKFFEF